MNIGTRSGITAALALAAMACAGQPADACEWCGAPEAPDGLTATTTIADPGEPGTRLVLTGTVYEPDGVTPAADVLLYAYHTNVRGRYPRRGDETGNARRHGYLRGWLVTGADGRYEIRTIVPASYPSRRDPAHIHMTVQEPDRAEYWIDDVLFEGDPKLTGEVRAERRNRGGSGIVTLFEREDGVMTAVRDIVLWRGDERD